MFYMGLHNVMLFCWNMNIHHYFSNKFFCCFFHNSNGKQNSLSVELWWEKIEGILRRANTEPSIDFSSANTEPSMDFIGAITEPSMDLRRANTETYYK